MEKLEAEIKKYLEERGWDKLKPADVAKSISIEAGELLELFQWSDEELGEVKKSPEKLAAIRKELADVLIYALEMAVLLDLDAEKVIADKLEHIRKKYPAEVMKNRNTEASSDDAYLKIKQDYRRKGL